MKFDAGFSARRRKKRGIEEMGQIVVSTIEAIDWNDVTKL